MRLFKPSWWTYHLRHRNVPLFWWRYFTTPLFPEGMSSLDELVEFGKHHQIMGFNHQTIRAYIIWNLHRYFNCTSFVETGTLYGQTTAYARRLFKTPIFTSEIYPTYYGFSKANLAFTTGVSQYKGNSTDFLRNVCRESVIGENPMFYLDAHWYEYLPLAEEIGIIQNQCERGVIVIDDFFVAGSPGFDFDEYPGARIDRRIVDSVLGKGGEKPVVYEPSYPSEREPYGKATGFGVVLLGQDEELPLDEFPFDLMNKAATEQ